MGMPRTNGASRKGAMYASAVLSMQQSSAVQKRVGRISESFLPSLNTTKERAEKKRRRKLQSQARALRRRYDNS